MTEPAPNPADNVSTDAAEKPAEAVEKAAEMVEKPAELDRAADAPRDISQVLMTDWERRPMPEVGGKRDQRFQVVIRQSVLNQIHRHGLADQGIEVCGVLVGKVYHDDNGPWLYVERAIEGNQAASRSTQVTFTAGTWAQIQSVMDRDYPDLRVVGWYHTHPGFGIFLSDMDVFIQENFFNEPWQVALVYDPKAAEEGVFVWKQGKPEIDALLIQADELTEHRTLVVRQAKAVPKGGVASADVAVLAERLEAIERRQKWILIFLAIVALIALAWPLALTTFLPDFMKRSTQSPPPANVPNYDDPTQRSGRLGVD